MGHPRQEQTRTLLPSTNRSYTPVDSRQSRYIDKCDMHKLLFAVVHLLLDKASCYILDKSGETPSATYGRVEKGYLTCADLADQDSLKLKVLPGDSETSLVLNHLAGVKTWSRPTAFSLTQWSKKCRARGIVYVLASFDGQIRVASAPLQFISSSSCFHLHKLSGYLLNGCRLLGLLYFCFSDIGGLSLTFCQYPSEALSFLELKIPRFKWSRYLRCVVCVMTKPRHLKEDRNTLARRPEMVR